MEFITEGHKSIAVFFDGTCWVAGQAVGGKAVKLLARERSRQMAIDCAIARYDAMSSPGEEL